MALATASAAAANPVCTAAGMFSGAAGKACDLASHAGKALSVGKKLAGGHVGGAIRTFLSGNGGGGGHGVGGTSSFGGTAGGLGGSSVSTTLGLTAIGVWILGGAKFALHETATVLSQTTTPQLRSTWFSSTYWRMTAISAVLTLPFLFAAAIQSLLRSDLMLLGRAAFCYLPIAMLAVSIAAPLTMLLLAASDEMSRVVASAAGQAGTRFLDRGAAFLGAFTVASGSPFIAFLVGVLTAGAALALWLELLMREAAIYVIVLLLPVVFAAFVWPARRIWAIRSLEVLLALILSKFAIVAVLALGGAALGSSGLHPITGSLAGIVLLAMGAFAPWALLRLVPMAELASGAAGALRAETRAGIRASANAAGSAAEASDAKWGHDWAAWMMSGMRRHADDAAGTDAQSGTGSNRDPLAEMVAAAGSNGSNGLDGSSSAGASATDEDAGAPDADETGSDGSGDAAGSSGTDPDGAASSAYGPNGTGANPSDPDAARFSRPESTRFGSTRPNSASARDSSPSGRMNASAPTPRSAPSADINSILREPDDSLEITLGGSSGDGATPAEDGPLADGGLPHAGEPAADDGPSAEGEPASGGAPPAEDAPASGGAPPADGGPPEPEPSGSPAEDHDPPPPAQPPEGGHL